MQLKDHDLRQLDAERLRQLGQRQPDALVELSVRLLDDLKEARERLNQNPSNSSRPPSSRDPWSRGGATEEKESTEPQEVAAAQAEAPQAEPAAPSEEQEPPAEAQAQEPPRKARASTGRKPGKQKGAPGHARTQVLKLTGTEDHLPLHCALCNAPLAPEQAKCYTAYQDVDVRFGSPDQPGLTVLSTQHRFFEAACSCGHHTRAEPYRAPSATGDWAGVELTQWRLIGSGLASLLVWLHFRMHLSIRRCREFCWELLGLSLSNGAIQEALLEASRACEPIPQQLQEELQHSDLLHADETPHLQAGEPLWLWVLASINTVLFFIGRRTKEMLRARLGTEFAGWLMSDGYSVYREYHHRLRCWAHLIRKARALAETFTPWVQGYGVEMLGIFDVLIDKVQQAREGPPQNLQPALAEHLAQLQALCEKMARSRNDKARQLGRELLNDWDAIFQVLAVPHLPLTNNFAERLLRHWVILRRITQGTRSAQGSLALATFASIIETCRLRHASPLRYLHQVLRARRVGLNVPPLPAVPMAA